MMYDFTGSYGTDSWGITIGTGGGGYTSAPVLTGTLPGYTLPGYTLPGVSWGSGMSVQTKQMLLLAGVVLVAFLLMRR